MDHHTVAAVSLVGICIDVLGGLYLAYDLLGGQHGPLRLLTRMATYSILFGLGYGLGLGLLFGIAAGLTIGIAIAIELQRAGYRNDHYSLPWEILFSAIRACGSGLALYFAQGLAYAIAFSGLLVIGQTIAYSRSGNPEYSGIVVR